MTKKSQILKAAVKFRSESISASLRLIAQEVDKVKSDKDLSWAHQGTLAEVDARLTSILNFLQGE